MAQQPPNAPGPDRLTPSPSPTRRPRRRTVVAAGAGALLLAVTATGGYLGRYELREAWYEHQLEGRYNGAVMEKQLMIAGGNPEEAGKESKESATIAAQFAQARTAPIGIVAPGAYDEAYTSMMRLPHSPGRWREVTKVPYHLDDQRYRDWFSNSSGGAGHVTGRVTGLTADSDGYVYAASADGGVFRSTTGGGRWTPIADALPSPSGGDVQLNDDNTLWYATGEANASSTSFVGAGVYRLGAPKTGTFSVKDRVGGHELESTTIGHLRRGRHSTMFAATNRGIWYHDSERPHEPWTFGFAPNMDWMPQIKDDSGKVLVPKGQYWDGNGPSGATKAAFKNIVNDIIVDTRRPYHVMAAVGWRSGDDYNGLYETDDFRKGPKSWHRVDLGGDLSGTDIGYTTFAASESTGHGGTGHRLYALVQQPSKAAGASNLKGVYVSDKGRLSGPWRKIADAEKLRGSGSALGDTYDVGVQAWYNQFLKVDPANPDHVWVGLEEVFETKDAGESWKTISPYWNFPFDCWNSSNTKNRCPMAPHSDQHSVAVGALDDKPRLFIGNDGGVYSRPVHGSENEQNHATDWRSETQDGSMDALQYYSVSVGKDVEHGGVVVSGGLQDNGVSNLFAVKPNGTNADPGHQMGSNFGGDGGDGVADPRNGCNQLQEYTNLAVRVTNNCAVNPDPGAQDEKDAKSRDIDPHDKGARFIAPISIDRRQPDHVVAGGRYVWTNDSAWTMRTGADWTKAFDLGEGHSATAVERNGSTTWAAWCGPCNNHGFARGLATNAGGTWHQVTLPKTFPNRFVQGVGVDPKDEKHAFLAVNGFSHRFTEGPGAGVGHVFETKDGGATWTDVSADLPDVPASSIRVLPDGGLAVATDLGVAYRQPGRTRWENLGNGFPTTTVMKLEVGPDGMLYAATHGRGIWSIPLPR